LGSANLRTNVQERVAAAQSIRNGTLVIISSIVVLAVKKVLRAPIFLHLHNFETERYMSEKHGIKSGDLQEIYEFNLRFFVVSRFVPKLRKF